MDMLEPNPMYDEQSIKLADAPNLFSPWNCDALVLKIRAIDGCTPSEAKRQIDEMAQRCNQLGRLPFSSRPCRVEARRTAPVYLQRTDGSLLLWIPRSNLFPMPENDRP